MVEASWWRPWPLLLLLLLLLARVAMGKEDLTNSVVSFLFRLQGGSLNVGSNTLLPPPRLPPPPVAAAAAPTPWNEFCNESVEHDSVPEVRMRIVAARNSFVLALLC